MANQHMYPTINSKDKETNMGTGYIYIYEGVYRRWGGLRDKGEPNAKQMQTEMEAR